MICKYMLGLLRRLQSSYKKLLAMHMLHYDNYTSR